MTGTKRPPAAVNERRQRHDSAVAAARPCRRDGRHSAPPKSRPGAYAPSSGAGPGRRPIRHPATRAQPVRVLLPDEPPALTPAAARALLRILLKAQAAQEGANQMTDNQAEASLLGEER